MEVTPASLSGIKRAIEVLHRGGIVAHATETCYGLACDLSNPKAVERLFLIKERPFTQPVSALFSSIEEAQKFVVFSKRALSLAKKHLPGPLTLVLPIRNDAPFPIHVCPPFPSPNPQVQSPTIGIRLSSHSLAQSLVRAFGRPIATTSANLHGFPNPYSVADIESQFLGKNALPDLIIDSGTLPTAPPSTIVEVVSDTDAVRVLRQGDLVLRPDGHPSHQT